MAIGAMAVAILFQEDREANPTGGMAPEQWLQLAVRLEQRGLPEEALDAYRIYLDRAPLDNAARARVCLNVAKLAYDAERYAEALVFLHQADLLDAQGTLKGDTNPLIVGALERLGRTDDLRRELRAQTDPGTTPALEEDDSVVLAEFGDQTITMAEFEEKLAGLPPALREHGDTPEGRRDLLRNMVAERLLIERAYRLGYDEDPAIQQQLDDMRDALVVQRLLRSALEDTDDDKPDTTDEPHLGMLGTQTEHERIRDLFVNTLETRDIRFYPERLEEMTP